MNHCTHVLQTSIESESGRAIARIFYLVNYKKCLLIFQSEQNNIFLIQRLRLPYDLVLFAKYTVSNQQYFNWNDIWLVNSIIISNLKLLNYYSQVDSVIIFARVTWVYEWYITIPQVYVRKIHSANLFNPWYIILINSRF